MKAPAVVLLLALLILPAVAAQEQPPGPVVGDFEAIASAPTGQSTREYTAFVRSYAQDSSGNGGASETIDWTPYGGFPGTDVDASKSRTTLIVNWNARLFATGLNPAGLAGVVRADNLTVPGCQASWSRATGEGQEHVSNEMRCEVPQGYIGGFADIELSWSTTNNAAFHRHSIMVVQTEVINVTQLFMVDGNVTFPAGSFNLEQNVTNQTVTNLTVTNQTVQNQTVGNLTMIPDEITILNEGLDFWFPMALAVTLMIIAWRRNNAIVAVGATMAAFVLMIDVSWNRELAILFIMSGGWIAWLASGRSLRVGV